MAKVATGQKLTRLPPGKIFGMTVTEPKPMSSHTENENLAQRISSNELEDPAKKDHCSSAKNSAELCCSQESQIDCENPTKCKSSQLDIDDSKEVSVSQTSVETLARLFPSTKLSVLQLVLQRCGQDLLKAIEYFASESLGIPANSSSSSTSAFHPPHTVTESSRPNSEQIAGTTMFGPIYSTFPRNLYGDSYCLLNILPEPFPKGLVATDTSSCPSTLPIMKSNPSHDQDNLALNVQYTNYFNSSVQQQLRDHMCTPVTDHLSTRPSVFHLPPVLPGIPCVQPNCTQCAYKFV